MTLVRFYICCLDSCTYREIVLTSDTVWYIYWISLEAAIAIIMVSITGFRGLFGASDSTRGSTGRTPTPLLDKISHVSSRMSRYFVWTTNSSQAASRALSSDPNNEEKSIPNAEVSETQAAQRAKPSFFFRWTTHTTNSTIDQSTCNDTDETSKLYKPSSSGTGPATAMRSVDTSGISMPSRAMSPLSSMNHNISPLSSGVGVGGTRTSHNSVEGEELPIFMHSGSVETPRQGAPPKGLDSWAITARRAAMRDYEHRSKLWAKNGRLTPPAESWTFDHS